MRKIVALSLFRAMALGAQTPGRSLEGGPPEKQTPCASRPRHQSAHKGNGARDRGNYAAHKFDSDDRKEKQTARKMIDMVASIDQNNFNGHPAVRRFTCHEDHAHPDHAHPLSHPPFPEEAAAEKASVAKAIVEHAPPNARP